MEYEGGLGYDVYEMPLRKYDPTIARWSGIDPVTHHSQSTYNAFDGNPVYYADLSGVAPRGYRGLRYDWGSKAYYYKGRYIGRGSLNRILRLIRATKTTWYNNNSTGFYTNRGGYVNYDGSGYEAPLSSGANTVLPTVRVTLGNMDSYQNAANQTAKNIYNTKWYSKSSIPVSSKYLLAKLYSHFQIGGRKGFNINASTLDFSYTNQRELGLMNLEIGKSMAVNLFDAKINSNSLAFGKLEFKRLSSSQFSIKTNTFDFDYQLNASFSRNAGTVLGAVINYNVPQSLLLKCPILTLVPLVFGGPFDVIFNGNVTVPK